MAGQSKAASNSGNGLGFGTVLFLVFLVLKLTGVITWSWWWVTAPLWGAFALIAVVFIVVFLFAVAFGGRR